MNGAYVNFFRLGGSPNYWQGDSSSSPLNRSETDTLPPGATQTWRVDFSNFTTMEGNFYVELTFEYPSGLRCTRSSSLVVTPPPPATQTRTPTRTTAPTRTPTRTPTSNVTNTPTPTPTVTNTLAPTPTSFND